MTRKITVLFLLIICYTVAAMAASHTYTLVIDAGHGGKDPGTIGKYSKEKHIALSVALAFGRYVENNCPDVRVIYTRKTDVFIPLKERAAIANRNKADVFISIHVNSVASKKPIAGLETYTMGMRRSGEKLSAAMRENDVILIEDNYKQHYSGFDPRSPESYIIFEMINDANMLQSVELAKTIQKNVCRTAARPNKGVKQDAFLVLRETSMPACLVELGYITTPSEEAVLNDAAKIDAMGRGIYQAFVEYKAKSTGKSLPQVQEPEQQPAVTAAEPVTRSVAADSVVAPAPVAEQVPVVAAPASDLPVFKVQFMALDRQIPASDARFKGLKDVDCYQEGGMWKYTVGATTDYAAIRQLRAQVAQTFPQAFVVAFKNGSKTDVQSAIREIRNKK